MSKKKIKIRDNDPESEREINLYDNPIPSRELILQVTATTAGLKMSIMRWIRNMKITICQTDRSISTTHSSKHLKISYRN